MRTTTDMLTNKRFRWNETVIYAGFVAPSRLSNRASVTLHPDRVPLKLLRELNPDAVLPPGCTWCGRVEAVHGIPVTDHEFMEPEGPTCESV